MLIVSSVKKSNSWAKDSWLSVVRFISGATSGSKFAAGSLADNESYSLTYDLQVIYAKECKDDDGNFDSAAAFRLFKSEMLVGAEEPVNGYEFSISELSHGKIDAVKIVQTGRVMRTMRPACYGGREKAFLLAANNLRAQLAKKRFVPYEDESSNEDEQDEEE